MKRWRGEIRLVLCALDALAPQGVRLRKPTFELLLDVESDFECHRRDRFDGELPHVLIDDCAGDPLAVRGRVFDSVTLTHVLGDKVATRPKIPHRHSDAALAADDDPLQQRGPFARRAPAPIAAVPSAVLPQQFLVAFEIVPTDVAGVRLSDERNPFLARKLLVACIADLALSATPVGKCSGVAGVVQEP